MTPKRILMLFTIMNRGGAETMVMNYYRHIDRTKLQFDFLVHRKERGDYDDEIEELGGKIYRLSPISLKNLFKYKQEVKVFFDKYSHLYNGVHGHCSELGYWIYKEASKRGFSFIAAHGHNANVPWDKKYAFRTILKHAMRPYLTHCFSCGLEAAVWLFGKKRASRTIILPNAIDANKYEYNKERSSQLKNKFGWKNNFVVGNVASFKIAKNHTKLLEIFKYLLNKKPEARLVLVGKKEGLYHDILKQAENLGIKNHVEFLGTRSDIPDLLNAFDVCLMPSLHEGLSVAMVEAQAAGLRIVTSENVPREIQLCQGLVDFIPLSKTPEEWACCTILHYERRNTYNEICNAGFDIIENAKKLQQLYLEETGK